MNNKNIVIFGAGQTGRGFINRFAQLDGDKTTFIDSNEKLVFDLNKKGLYKIIFSSNRKDLVVNNYVALTLDDPSIDTVLRNADIIFISVGAANVINVGHMLNKIQFYKPINIVTAENGVKVSNAISFLRKKKNIFLCESIIFCTTLKLDKGLDIFSEDLDFFPYDYQQLGQYLPIDWLVPIQNFDILVQRKIYTYNCVSAVIAYLGYYKKYQVFSDAANDKEIEAIVELILKVLNISIAKKYNISLSEQNDFSEKAVIKFKNAKIIDTVSRNCRNVMRKLLPNERLIGPLQLIFDFGYSSKEFLLVIACALFYGTREESYQFDLNTYLKGFPIEWSRVVLKDYNFLINGFSFQSILGKNY